MSLHQQGASEQDGPPIQHLDVRPVSRLVRLELHHEVVVIAHHRVGTDRDAEDRGQDSDSIFNPAPAVLVALARVPIDAAEKGPTNASGGDVVVGRVGDTDPVFPGARHSGNTTDTMDIELVENRRRVPTYVPVHHSLKPI